jgi:hypothetical protein
MSSRISLEKGPTDDIDADLLDLRKQLAAQVGEGFHFYRSPIIERWQTGKRKGTKGEDIGPARLNGALPSGQPLQAPEDASRLEDLNKAVAAEGIRYKFLLQSRHFLL